MATKHSILERLGENVRRIRLSKGMSQEELALEAGLDRTYMGGIERGERNVAVLNLCKVARALGVQPGELFEGLEGDALGSGKN